MLKVINSVGSMTGLAKYFSGSCSNKEGIDILIKNNVCCQVEEYKEPTVGRIQYVKIKINKQPLVLINV